MSRLDGPLKVRGQAPFAVENQLEGLAYASLAFTTVATGRIGSLDVAMAERAPGVILVMTHRNAPRLNPMPAFFSTPQAVGNDDLPIMQDDCIHWNGQPIALVLAETQEQADHAASLVRAAYAHTDQAVTGIEAATKHGTEQGFFAGQPLRDEKGDAVQAFRDASVRIDEIYTTPPLSHNAMEPHAATVRWEGERLVVHDASQAVAHSCWTLGQIFGIDPALIRVTSPFVGGGFGAKTI